MTQQSLPNPATSARLIGLDLLRLLAVVMVLGRHMEQPPSDLPGRVKAGLDIWNGHGGLGVDLFFVLSGFLISGLLFAEYRKYGEISIKRFYVRRAWKIYPAFYCLFAFSYLYPLIAFGIKMRDRQAFTELFFIQSYQQGYWNHSWTLAVEEHFYIALPLLLLFLTRKNRGDFNPFRAIPWIIGATSTLVLGVRIVNYLVRTDYSYHTHTWATHLRFDALFFGVAIGYAYHFHGEWFRQTFRPWRFGCIALGVALLGGRIVVVQSDFYAHTFGFTQQYLGAAAIMVGIVMCKITANRLTKPLATLGAYSYSIYLWHMALMYWAIPHLREAGISWTGRTAIFMVGAFVIGVPMAKLVELPTLKLRDRWFPSRSGATAGVPLPETRSAPQRRAA